MSLNFIKAWRNDKWYNKRVLIWCFTLVLIKINYGQIGDQTGLFYTTNPVFYTGQLVRWKSMFFWTKLIFIGFVNLCYLINIWNGIMWCLISVTCMKNPYTMRSILIQQVIALFIMIWLIFGVLMPLSAISWWPVLVVEEAGVPGENHQPWASNW